MAFPKVSEIEIAILKEIENSGGQVTAAQIYKRLISHLPSLTQEDLSKKLPSGDNAWRNKIRWAKQLLVQKGEVVTIKIWSLGYYR